MNGKRAANQTTTPNALDAAERRTEGHGRLAATFAERRAHFPLAIFARSAGRLEAAIVRRSNW